MATTHVPALVRQLAPIIEANLGPCTTLAAADGFHLYQAKRPVEVRTSNRESRAERDWRRNL